MVVREVQNPPFETLARNDKEPKESVDASAETIIAGNLRVVKPFPLPLMRGRSAVPKGGLGRVLIAFQTSADAVVHYLYNAITVL